MTVTSSWGQSQGVTVSLVVSDMNTQTPLAKKITMLTLLMPQHQHLALMVMLMIMRVK